MDYQEDNDDAEGDDEVDPSWSALNEECDAFVDNNNLDNRNFVTGMSAEQRAEYKRLVLDSARYPEIQYTFLARTAHKFKADSEMAFFLQEPLCDLAESYLAESCRENENDSSLLLDCYTMAAWLLPCGSPQYQELEKKIKHIILDNDQNDDDCFTELKAVTVLLHGAHERYEEKKQEKYTKLWREFWNRCTSNSPMQASYNIADMVQANNMFLPKDLWQLVSDGIFKRLEHHIDEYKFISEDADDPEAAGEGHDSAQVDERKSFIYDVDEIFDLTGKAIEQLDKNTQVSYIHRYSVLFRKWQQELLKDPDSFNTFYEGLLAELDQGSLVYEAVDLLARSYEMFNLNFMSVTIAADKKEKINEAHKNIAENWNNSCGVIMEYAFGVEEFLNKEDYSHAVGNMYLMDDLFNRMRYQDNHSDNPQPQNQENSLELKMDLLNGLLYNKKTCGLVRQWAEQKYNQLDLVFNANLPTDSTMMKEDEKISFVKNMDLTRGAASNIVSSIHPLTIDN